jgi:SAM-dependent methyltransferase
VRKHDPTAYGTAIGGDYDSLYPASSAFLQTDAALDRLSQLASAAGTSRSLLELGIGTGRLALALADRGFRVAGIEGSPEIAEQLRAKPGSERISVTVGDFVDTRVPGAFSVVLMALNTIFAPATREDQIACFRNAARHVEAGGCFVVEAYVLRPEQLGGEWCVKPRSVEHDHVELQLARYDPAAGHVERTMVHLRADGVQLVPVRDAYAWPGELDLMAQAAGLRLRTRTGDWAGAPFSAASDRHVSVYELDVGAR